MFRATKKEGGYEFKAGSGKRLRRIIVCKKKNCKMFGIG